LRIVTLKLPFLRCGKKCSTKVILNQSLFGNPPLQLTILKLNSA